MSTFSEIAQITGEKGVEGIVGWHVPSAVQKIPHQTIRTYSPEVLTHLSRLNCCSVRLDPVQLKSGEWVAKFTKITGPWDKGAMVLMEKLELQYSDIGPSLVQFDIPVDDTWILAEYRVHLTCKPGVLRDVLIWETRKAPVEQYVTSYTWGC